MAALKEGVHTFANTVKALADLDIWARTQYGNCYFPSYVSTDALVRYARPATLTLGPANTAGSSHDRACRCGVQGREYGGQQEAGGLQHRIGDAGGSLPRYPRVQGKGREARCR